MGRYKQQIKIKHDEEYFKNRKDNCCPSCNKKLQKKYEGLVCKNFKCGLYFKLNKGWVYLNKEKKDGLDYFKDKYDFDIEEFRNKKKWLRKKEEIFHKRGRKCEICGIEISLHIHHIINRSESPCLTFDEENLIILCEKCHKKIHKENKYKFN